MSRGWVSRSSAAGRHGGTQGVIAKPKGAKVCVRIAAMADDSLRSNFFGSSV
jgi:hypothetical protein